MTKLTVDRLKTVLTYNESTGVFSWNDRQQSDFPNPHAYGSWKSSCLGKTPGSKMNTGYLAIRVDSRLYLAHRLAWLYHYGEWPRYNIDHINGNKHDNRVVNLRDVTNAENHRNVRRAKNNKSGVTGVRMIKNGFWRATITAKSKKKHLGDFESKEDAIAARSKAEHAYDYHPNHGRAA